MSGTGWACNYITLNLGSSPAETQKLAVPSKVTKPESDKARVGLDLAGWLGNLIRLLGFAASLGSLLTEVGCVIFHSISLTCLSGCHLWTRFGTNVSLLNLLSSIKPPLKDSVFSTASAFPESPVVKVSACLGKTYQPIHLSASALPRIHRHSNLVLR